MGNEHLLAIIRKGIVRSYYVEIRWIEGWRDGDGWTVNASYHVRNVTFTGHNTFKAIRRYLTEHKLLRKYAHVNILTCDGITYEVLAPSGEPLYHFILKED